MRQNGSSAVQFEAKAESSLPVFGRLNAGAGAACPGKGRELRQD